MVGYLENENQITRDELLDELLRFNIHCRPGYPSMSAMPNYERKFPVPYSERYWKHGIVFPTALNLQQEDIEYVYIKIKTLIEKRKL